MKKITGVHFDKINKKWIAKIGINGKLIKLGSFKKKTDAVKIRKKIETKKNNAEKDVFWSKNGNEVYFAGKYLGCFEFYKDAVKIRNNALIKSIEKRKQKTKKSPIKGVHFSEIQNKWIVKFTKWHQKYYIGSFEKHDDAAIALFKFELRSGKFAEYTRSYHYLKKKGLI